MLYPDKTFTNPLHKIEIHLVGCGGTGSRVLVELSALSQNLVEMGHLGFNISVFDSDIVEQHNIGRQMFYQSDLGYFKSNVLASRINRSYGDNIKSFTTNYDVESLKKSDILISCVDNVTFRKSLHFALGNMTDNFIWIDTGNDKNSGQVFMSIFNKKGKLTPTCVDVFPNMQDVPEEPSCSTRDALKKQSFTINKFIANFTIQFLNNIFIDYQIPYTQLHFNSNPFKIKTK